MIKIWIDDVDSCQNVIFVPFSVCFCVLIYPQLFWFCPDYLPLYICSPFPSCYLWFAVIGCHLTSLSPIVLCLSPDFFSCTRANMQYYTRWLNISSQAFLDMFTKEKIVYFLLLIFKCLLCTQGLWLTDRELSPQ